MHKPNQNLNLFYKKLWCDLNFLTGLAPNIVFASKSYGAVSSFAWSGTKYRAAHANVRTAHKDHKNYMHYYTLPISKNYRAVSIFAWSCTKYRAAHANVRTAHKDRLFKIAGHSHT